jgi:hypothetical protein
MRFWTATTSGFHARLLAFPIVEQKNIINTNVGLLAFNQ